MFQRYVTTRWSLCLKDMSWFIPDNMTWGWKFLSCSWWLVLCLTPSPALIPAVSLVRQESCWHSSGIHVTPTRWSRPVPGRSLSRLFCSSRTTWTRVSPSTPTAPVGLTTTCERLCLLYLYCNRVTTCTNKAPTMILIRLVGCVKCVCTPGLIKSIHSVWRFMERGPGDAAGEHKPSSNTMCLFYLKHCLVRGRFFYFTFLFRITLGCGCRWW